MSFTVISNTSTGFGIILNASPIIVLNTPINAAALTDSTPTLSFTGTDADFNDIKYNLQLDSVATFDSITLLDVVSGIDDGFYGSPDNSSPYASGQSIQYTIQSPISDGVYYWRVRGIDPNGINKYGAWSSVNNFTLDTSLNNFTDNIKLNIDDIWKDISAVYINIGGNWMTVLNMQINIANEWKDISIG